MGNGRTLSLDIKGWHIWQNTQGRIICNGPTLETRLLDFPDLDHAVNWFWLNERQDIARALNKAHKELGQV